MYATENTAQPIVLGIDGGGTNTRAVIAQGDRVLGRATCGSIKQLRVGYEAADANLRALLREVFYSAPSGVKVEAASAGVASASMPGVREWIAQTLTEFGISLSEVVGDEMIALDAAFRGGPGILQIAGTGSHCIARAPDGVLERVGGYSFVLGDEGSGYWIGHQGVRRALRAHDREDNRRAGYAENLILVKVMDAWGAASLGELIPMGNAVPSRDFAALAPLIAKAADEGDAVALEILRDAANDLAGSILIAYGRLRRLHKVKQEIPVAWTGSVLERMDRVRSGMIQILQENAPGLRIVEKSVTPVEGALWRASRLASEGSHPV